MANEFGGSIMGVKKARHALSLDPALVVLDATVLLHAPMHDGDYRAENGYAGWLDGHIPGSRHIDLLDALSDPSVRYSFGMPSVATLQDVLRKAGVGPEQGLLIYDRSDGFWAARLWWMLRSVGMEAQVLDGGWRAWQAAAYPSAKGPNQIKPARRALSLTPLPGCWCDRSQVEAVMTGQREGRLVCALSRAAFLGETFTRYARRGHIPGSLNLPARVLQDTSGCYLSAQQIRQLAEASGLTVSQPLLIYCGGGIAASCLALGLTEAGYNQVSVYDGSLQEWAEDCLLPLDTK